MLAVFIKVLQDLEANALNITPNENDYKSGKKFNNIIKI